jgi:hypothetical protein
LVMCLSSGQSALILSSIFSIIFFSVQFFKSRKSHK